MGLVAAVIAVLAAADNKPRSTGEKAPLSSIERMKQRIEKLNKEAAAGGTTGGTAGGTAGGAAGGAAGGTTNTGDDACGVARRAAPGATLACTTTVRRGVCRSECIDPREPIDISNNPDIDELTLNERKDWPEPEYPKMISCGDYMSLTKGACDAGFDSSPATHRPLTGSGRDKLCYYSEYAGFTDRNQAKCSPAYCCNMTTCGTWRDTSPIGQSLPASMSPADQSLARRYLTLLGSGTAGARGSEVEHVHMQRYVAAKRCAAAADAAAHEAARAICLAERRFERPAYSRLTRTMMIAEGIDSTQLGLIIGASAFAFAAMPLLINPLSAPFAALGMLFAWIASESDKKRRAAAKAAGVDAIAGAALQRVRDLSRQETNYDAACRPAQDDDIQSKIVQEASVCNPGRGRQPRRWTAGDDRTPCHDCGATCCGPADPTGRTDTAFDTCQYGVSAFANPIFTNPTLAVKQGLFESVWQMTTTLGGSGILPRAITAPTYVHLRNVCNGRYLIADFIDWEERHRAGGLEPKIFHEPGYDNPTAHMGVRAVTDAYLRHHDSEYGTTKPMWEVSVHKMADGDDRLRIVMTIHKDASRPAYATADQRADRAGLALTVGTPTYLQRFGYDHTRTTAPAGVNADPVSLALVYAERDAVGKDESEESKNAATGTMWTVRDVDTFLQKPAGPWRAERSKNLRNWPAAIPTGPVSVLLFDGEEGPALTHYHGPTPQWCVSWQQAARYQQDMALEGGFSSMSLDGAALQLLDHSTEPRDQRGACHHADQRMVLDRFLQLDEAPDVGCAVEPSDMRSRMYAPLAGRSWCVR